MLSHLRCEVAVWRPGQRRGGRWFGAYLDMLVAPGDGSAPMFKKVKYVFTNPEGAIANLEFLGDQIASRGLNGKLTIEVFDFHGSLRVARSPGEVVTLDRHLRMQEAARE